MTGRQTLALLTKFKNNSFIQVGPFGFQEQTQHGFRYRLLYRVPPACLELTLPILLNTIHSPAANHGGCQAR